ncbi:hypothetical protein ABEB36_006616 [Hypothenemus hampei]|uniref:Eukaryotic translation initiation factor 4E transporter n=1 Tax=Hypothenemus hampei TaxID=57062 RepID=A0ABD1EV26_HYPHA
MTKTYGPKPSSKDKDVVQHNLINHHLSSIRKHHQKHSTKRVSWRDEQIQNMSVREIDPAILAVRLKIRYTAEQLLEIGKLPASKVKPEGFNPAPGIASCFIANLEKKKSDFSDHKSSDPDNRRRSGDPRERIRKENDGIVLSPQRRSFNSGCFVPANKEPKADVPPPHLIGVRDIGGTSTRRIGSGRIMRDSWDTDKEPESDFTSFSRVQRGPDREERGRSFGRDQDGGGKEKDINRRNSRYSNEGRRRYSESKEDEPEWFSSGPISQNDTIELRGFDDSDKPKTSKARQERNKQRVKDWFKKKGYNCNFVDVKEKEDEETKENKNGSEPEPTEEKGDNNQREPNTKAQLEGQTEDKRTTSHASEHSFDFDEFLKGENIPGLLPNGVGAETEKSTSRFSRWFKKDSPVKDEGPSTSSRKSSLQEDNHIKHLLEDINESNAYFAPISPAGLMDDKNRSSLGQPVNIMDMLSRGNRSEGWNAKPSGPGMGSKILSLDELEAKYRQNSSSEHSKPHVQKPDEEMTAAFKRLQAGGGSSVPQNGPMNKPPAMSLLEMLSHSQQQDEARLAAAQQQQLFNTMHPQQQPMHNDLALKMQQAQLQQKQQIDMLGKLMSANAIRASPLLDMGAQQSRELLTRPEAQAILQGLTRGEITAQHLCQQLANPALQPRHREMLVTILKLQGSGNNYGPSPRVLSPAPMAQHHLYAQQQQQQQQLRVSPLPPNAMHQRVPSPRELQVHTQNILQRALIKKKLEEQTENFRKKQEMQQRGASPNMGIGSQQAGQKGIVSPTPLAFTPTSVLRKMTAEKDEGKENKAIPIIDNGVKPQGRPLTGMRPNANVNSQQWMPSQMPFSMKQAGRPIVKANNNFQQSQTPDQFFAQLAAQQQQQQQQQPPLPQQRIYQPAPTAASRKPIIGQQYAQSVNAQGSQYGSSQQSQFSHPNSSQNFSQPTAQQLRAQHQHRPSASTSVTSITTNNGGAATPANQQTATAQPVMGFNQQGAQPQGTVAWQQFLNNSNVQQQEGGRSSQQGGGQLSPSTADQLTRWFSPDLLERARGGELPSTANLARLEEIERHQAAPPVHN